MGTLMDRIARALTVNQSKPANEQFAAAGVAANKREMERRLRAQGLSRSEAKKATAAYFRSLEK